MIIRDTIYLFKQTHLYFLQYQKTLATALISPDWVQHNKMT